MRERLDEILTELLEKWECQQVEFGGKADRVYLLFGAHPTVKPSDLVKNLKSVSARRMRREFAQSLAPVLLETLLLE